MSSEPKKVLVAVDDSDKEDVFDFYMSNLHRKGNEITILHVTIERDMVAHTCGPVTAIPAKPNWSEYRRLEEKQAAAAKTKYKNKLVENKVEGKVEVLVAPKPGEAIIEQAIEGEASLIVIGTGETTICNSLRCTVKDYVFRNAPCPVIACRR